MKLIGQDRNQFQMICLENFISPESYARVVDAFVDFLPLEKIGFEIKGEIKNGRPAYPTATLLKLYFYGYINRVRSSRRLQREAETNMEAIWLLKGLVPCYKTISDFRAVNSGPFKSVFKEFNIFLRGEKLFSEDTVATDGSKFRAQNSKKNNYNEKKINGHLNYIEKQTEQYIKEMDELDQQEDAEEIRLEQATAISEKLDHLTKRKKKYDGLKGDILEAHEKGVTQISTTDPDARALPKKMNIVEVGYNAVITCEADNKLITNFETLNEHDTYALSDAALNAREALGKKEGEHIRQLADKGFDTGAELKTCIENNVLTYVAPKSRVNTKKDEKYNKDKFVYDEEKDAFICPENNELKSNGNWYNKNNGKLRKAYRVKHYKLPFDICNTCPFRLECAGESNLKNSKGKYIERTEYEEYIDENTERVKLNKELYRKRQEIVEHLPKLIRDRLFGTIKRQWGYDHTLLKGMEKVSGEFAIIFTTYNLRRAISIFGVKTLVNKLREASFFIFRDIWGILKRYKPVFFKNMEFVFLKNKKINGLTAA
jgi:transposase